jgi:hypothetical protein
MTFYALAGTPCSAFFKQYPCHLTYFFAVAKKSKLNSLIEYNILYSTIHSTLQVALSRSRRRNAQSLVPMSD